MEDRDEGHRLGPWLRLRKLRKDDPEFILHAAVAFMGAALLITITVVLLWWRLHL
jgi:hypothetical protein